MEEEDEFYDLKNSTIIEEESKEEDDEPKFDYGQAAAAARHESKPSKSINPLFLMSSTTQGAPVGGDTSEHYMTGDLVWN